uniref:Reverse transcriptase zinc-binding domain-containing protein n=1 Tax=Photinus pyralis TaxID=7054 RepID=A0A1Y1KZ52_PHOPY
MTGKRRIDQFTLEVFGERMIAEKSIKILGITIDKCLHFTEHARGVCGKAIRCYEALKKILPNTGGARATKRKVLAAAVMSIVLYGSEVWGSAMKWGVAANMTDRVTRLLAVSIASGYRTVQSDDIMVIAALPPGQLMVRARMEGWDKARLNQEWQERWERRQSWTRKLIPNLDNWVDRLHGEVGYHLTQFLTGHGENAVYLLRIGKRDSDECVDCGDRDTEGHAVFECQRWTRGRIETETEVAATLQPENIIQLMIESESKWTKIARFVITVVQTREREAWTRGQ